MRKYIVLIVCLALSCVALTCQAQENQTSKRTAIPQMTDDDLNNKNSSANSGNTGDSQNDNDPHALIERSAGALDKLKSFRMQVLLSGNPDGDIILSKVEVVNPGRIYSRSEREEMIEIGLSTWKREGAGRWSEIQKQGNISPGEMLKAMMSLVENPGISISEETKGKVSLIVYSFTEPAGGYVKIWIGKADGLPRRTESGNSASPVKTVMTFYDFNAPIIINAPKK